MNVKTVIPLVAGLAIGGIALKLGADTLKKARGAQQVDMVDVWTAAEDVFRGQMIEEHLLKSMKFPSKLVPEWAFTDKEEVIGRVAKSTTFTGEIFHSEALLPEGARPGLPVPKGVRAVAVKIDESSGVDYHLEPGSRVDVVASFQVREGAKQKTIARTILENVEVAAVGQRTHAIVTTSEEDEGRNVRKVRAVTLFVPPDKVPTLHLAENRGRIKLSMRGDGHSDVGALSKAAPVNEDELLGRKTEKKNPLGAQASGFFANLFSGSKDPKPEPEPQPPVVQKPAQPTGPQYVHVMVVRNGEQVTRYGWMEGATEAVEIKEDASAMRVSSATQPQPAPQPTVNSPAQRTQPRRSTVQNQTPQPATDASVLSDAEERTAAEPEPEPEELPE
jgi:pilus assembly protein CpaB